MLSFTNTLFLLTSAYCASAAAESSSNVLPQNNCPQDIKHLNVGGVTSFPETATAPVMIISQDISTVTVELRQQWFPNVESVYYDFRQTKIGIVKNRCYHKTTVDESEIYDTITINCADNHPVGDLEICLSDRNNLPLENDATIPERCSNQVVPGCKSCREEDPDATKPPTVCYSLQIRCQSLCIGEVARNRGLRGFSLE